MSKWDEPVTIAVLPDHPTPCTNVHTADAVLFTVGWQVTKYRFMMNSCQSGDYGVLREKEFIHAFSKVVERDYANEGKLNQGIKYGSRMKIIPYIIKEIKALQNINTVLDGFSGATRVSQAFTQMGIILLQ